MCCKFALRPKPHLQAQPVGNHRDKFTVCWFALDARDRVAEVILQGFDVTAVPRDLDGVADRALDAAGRGHVALGDFGIKPLGHGVDVLRLVHGEQDGIPQELVALDVGGDAIREGQ